MITLKDMLAGRNYSIKKKTSQRVKEIEVPRKFLKKAHKETIKEPFAQYSVCDDDFGGVPLIIVRDFYNRETMEEKYYVHVNHYGTIFDPKIKADFAFEVRDLMDQLARERKTKEEEAAREKYMNKKSLVYQKINDALQKTRK